MKTLVIMGSHTNGSQYFDWTRKNCEVWLFNEAPQSDKYKQCDLFFQLHHEAIWKSPKNRSNEEHYKWLKSGKTPKVFMQDKFNDVPKSEKYPLNEVLNLTENTKTFVKDKTIDFRCFYSSPDFALAYLAKLWKQGKKYKKVELWGIELETESEYKYQRTGFGFWIGYLTALGVPLELYTSIFDIPVYGYEGDIEITSKHITERLGILSKEIKNYDYAKKTQDIFNLVPKLENTDASKEIENRLNKFTKEYEKLGITSGQIKESNRYLEKALAMENEAQSSVFSQGEFDHARMSFNKQYSDELLKAKEINTKLNLMVKVILGMKKNSKKRKFTVVEFGNELAELINQNRVLCLLIGGIRENEYYLNSSRLSIERSKNGN